jgi:hypothetical protein
MNETKIKSNGDPDVAIASDGSLHIIIPIKITRRGQSKVVMLPDGNVFKPRDWDTKPTQMQLALARGHRWSEMFESGNVRNLAEVARLEGIDSSYVSRMVNLTTLAPDIVEAILDGTLPDHVTLFDIASNTPLLWEDQRALLGPRLCG